MVDFEKKPIQTFKKNTVVLIEIRTVAFLWSKTVKTRDIFRYLKINSKQKDYAQSKAYFL